MARSLAGQTVGVLGLARSGLAAARLALGRGAKVYASDAGSSDAAREAAETVRSLGGDAETGGHDLGKLAACGRIVLSPGIPPTARVLKEDAIRGVPVIPEIEFAYEQLDSPVIAITGTNGKTTVTALIEHLMQADGIDAVAGGNIGTALSELAMREPQPAWAVVECSSFQLAGIDRFTPRIGILTNLAPDHLDWYDDVEDYYADKGRMYVNASADSLWILNAEDERDGVLWINDSKATNIASTRVAVRGMTRPTVLLLGGHHKGEPYTELLPDLEGSAIRTVIAYGEAAPLIQADLEGKAPLERVDGSFEEVVAHARRVARPGDVVLLSPACSSFDMFKTYEERGKCFAQLAREGA
jgi:UDP-N-acetylmuramoylalanine-D-glutamate ligase